MRAMDSGKPTPVSAVFIFHARYIKLV